MAVAFCVGGWREAVLWSLVEARLRFGLVVWYWGVRVGLGGGEEGEEGEEGEVV